MGCLEQLIVDLLVAMGFGSSHKDAAAQVTAVSMASSTRTALALIESTSRPNVTRPATLSGGLT